MQGLTSENQCMRYMCVHLHRIKVRNHVIISIGAEKSFGKLQQWKHSINYERERMASCGTGYLRNPTANILHNSEQLNDSPPRLGIRQKCCCPCEIPGTGRSTATEGRWVAAGAGAEWRDGDWPIVGMVLLWHDGPVLMVANLWIYSKPLNWTLFKKSEFYGMWIIAQKIVLEKP